MTTIDAKKSIKGHARMFNYRPSCMTDRGLLYAWLPKDDQVMNLHVYHDREGLERFGADRRRP
jgi:hypothetical protein